MHAVAQEVLRAGNPVATGFVWGAGDCGSVYQYDGGGNWERIAAPDPVAPASSE